MKTFFKFILAFALVLIGTMASASSVGFAVNGTYGYAYTFSPTSEYAQTYAPGGGVGLIELQGAGPNGWNYFECWGGTTVGNITTFSNNYFSIAGLLGSFSNMRWNSGNDTLTAAFSGQEFNGVAWVPFNGHLTAVFNFTQNYSYSDYSGYSYTLQYGNSNTVVISSVPEPGSLIMLGTGLLGIAGIARRRLKL